MSIKHRIAAVPFIPSYIPKNSGEIIEGMAQQVPESERKTLRVSAKVHGIWFSLYKGRLSMHQYIQSAVQSCEVIAQLVEEYLNDEIDEAEFTKAIAGDRPRKKR